jgi:ABC-type multidrug transport system permease subunit
VPDLPAFGCAAVRFLLSLPVIALACRKVGQPLTVNRSLWGLLAANAMLAVVQIGSFNWGTSHSLAGRSSVFINVYPLVVAPLAWIILGEDYQVRTDRLPFLIGVMILTAIAGAALGLTLGTMVQPQQIGLMFSLIFAPLLFLGCAYYPWGQLESIRWFQIVTLINPLTYASEGLRRSMVPQTEGVPFNTLPAVWVLLGLVATIVGFSLYGIHSFRNRVVS